MAAQQQTEALENMAEAAAAVAAGTETPQDAAHLTGANTQEGGASPGMPVGATTADEYLQPTGSVRRLCLCRGNCNGRVRHDPGQCGKRSVSDRPLCSSCKAHKGSSLEKTRTPEEYATGGFYAEQIGTSGEGGDGDGQQQQPVEGATGEHATMPMEAMMAGAQDGGGVAPGAPAIQHPTGEAQVYNNNPRKRSASARDLADAQNAQLKRLGDQLMQQNNALQGLQTCFLSLQESLQAVHRQQVMQLQTIQQLQAEVALISQKKDA